MVSNEGQQGNLVFQIHQQRVEFLDPRLGGFQLGHGVLIALDHLAVDIEATPHFFLLGNLEAQHVHALVTLTIKRKTGRIRPTIPFGTHFPEIRTWRP